MNAILWREVKLLEQFWRERDAAGGANASQGFLVMQVISQVVVSFRASVSYIQLQPARKSRQLECIVH
jgi:hypothetical protein